MFRKGRVIPGNKVAAVTVGYTTPRVEVAQILSYHASTLALMQTPAGRRAGFGPAGDYGAEGYFHHGPLPTTQFLTGQEAFRLAATRAAERRDYRTEVSAVAFRPFGSFGM